MAVAVEAAVKSCWRAGGDLNARFADELARVEFAPGAQSVVLPVPLSPALAWTAGKLSDLELLLTMNGSSEAIWFACLPNLRGYALALESARTIFQRGAQAIIARTKNPVVAGHMVRFGCRPVLVGEPGGNRYHGDAGTVRRWLSRLALTSDPRMV